MQVRSRAGVALGLLALLAAASSAAAEGPLTAHDVARLRQVSEVAVSPDGGRVAYLLEVPRDPFADEDGPARSELHLVGPDGAGRPYVAGKVEVEHIAWTPAGEIAFLAEREGDEAKSLYTIPPDGGEARRRLTHATDIAEYAFRPNGSAVAYLAKEAEDEKAKEIREKGFDQEIFEEDWRPMRVWIRELDPADGKEPEPRMLELPGSASALSWSPAGDRLAVALAPTPLIDDRYMRRKVHVVDVASGEVVARVEHPAKLGQVAWSPDGQRLAMVTGADVHDPKEGRLFVVDAESGEHVDVLPGYGGHVTQIGWDRRGDLLFVGDEGVETTLNRLPAGGGERRRIGSAGAAVWTGLSLARDADAVALVGESPRHPAEVFHLAPGGGAARRLTDSNPWLAGRALGAQEVVRFRARDGLELEGLLVRPLGRAEGERVPLVMIVHGGPESHHRNGWLTTYSRPAQVLAGLGFASFLTNYRGSTGRGVEFSKLSQGDPAGKEFDDLIDAVDHLIATGLVDGERVGITGGSYGGYATAWGATRYSDRFAAGVMFVGIANEISKIGTSDIPNELYLVHQRKWPWDDWQLSLERSPVYWVERARTPLLILHGKDDSRVFPGQSMELYRFLKVLGRAPVRLVLYPGEGHGNRRAASRLDYSLRMLRWMSHYLGGPGGEPPPHEIAYREEAVERAPEVERMEVLD